MEAAPVEILQEVASYLDLSDLLSLALVSRRVASCCRRSIFQHIAVLNTTSCLSELENLVTSGGLSTRQLSVYHGTWPTCTRDDWATHPLQVADAPQSMFSSQDKRATSDELAQGAFNAYLNFIKEERRRNIDDDQAQLERIMLHLPPLEKIVVSSLMKKTVGRLGKAKLAELRHQIRMSPTTFDSVGNLLDIVCRLLPRFKRIHSLHIRSRLAEFPTICELEWIRDLDIGALFLATTDTPAFVEFLRSFPNLQRLSVAAYRHHGFIFPLEDVQQSQLLLLRLAGVYVARHAVVDFVHRHTQLKAVSLNDVALVNGKWELILSALGNKATLIDLVGCT
ncbi:hypothetical protein BDP55DRAFT_647534 [Colletotrichum godetiae]|uniref:F-box domain-containing protein n=1 Tax=Colletotrichum godetiae TaxID=1209918 RepID=A0AAJ0F1E2_9PEZI|nr:uncharacterized protein BDP55DRAFT_647534 [Colletotrichum godetiae]KAK1691616.1 hypothetical protein BDP55DRAFT_647534 [Colletotrichum godetiae]